MPVQVTHNNDGHFYTIDVDIAKEGAQVFDLSTYFKARVADNHTGLRVRWFWQGQIFNTVGKKPRVEGVVGQYSFKKGTNGTRELVMSPDASPVASDGDVSACEPGGYATYYFPGQMFPQEGLFKGTIGLVDDLDEGAHYTSVDIWFKVYPQAGSAQMGRACDFYISELDKAIKEAEDDLAAAKKSMQKVVDDFTAKMNDLTNKLTTQATTDQAALAALETRIEQDNIVTKPQLDALEQTIQKQLTDSLTKLNGRLTNVEGNLEPYSVEQSDFNGKDVMHRGHLAVHKKTYGRYQNAAGMSVMVNGDDKAKVEGDSLEFIAKHYTGRDSAGLYVENSRIPYLLQTTDTRFTATSVTVLDGSVDLSNVKPGMLIDTSKRANIDKDWYVTAVKSVDGSTINTELWYKVQSDPNAETVTGTPADGLAITVNPTVGIWGINSNIFLPQEDAESGSAMELGVYSASKVPQDVVGLRVTSGQEDINDGVHVTGNVHQAYNAANRDGGTAYNVAPGAKVDYYFRAQNADSTTNYFINAQGQVMHETLVPHFTGTFKDLDYGKDTSLLIINSEGDQTITLDYGRYGRIIHIIATGTGVKTIVANPASSSATPGTSWFLSPDTKQGNASEIKLNREAGKPSVNLVDLGNLFAVL